jgi:hypothetical protein
LGLNLALAVGGFDCSSSGHSLGAPDGAVSDTGRPDAGAGLDASAAADSTGQSDGNSSADAAASTAASDASVCPAPAAPADLCKEVPSGTVSACSYDSAGQPSQTGYLEILGPDGSRRYVCAAAWVPGGAGGYRFDAPDHFMLDPQSCCGMNATPAAIPTTQQTAIGYLGAMHAPRDIKPQEMRQPGAGPLRQNPFAVVIEDSRGGAALSGAMATWQAWAGDGHPHVAPDGSGAYYFPSDVLINYVILETAHAIPVVIVGPEVSPTADGTAPLGHPTLGACAAGGGAPLALIAGEIFGTTLTNHSGRFGHDPSGTPEALADAAALLNCFGIPITSTKYYPPKP